RSVTGLEAKWLGIGQIANVYLWLTVPRGERNDAQAFWSGRGTRGDRRSLTASNRGAGWRPLDIGAQNVARDKVVVDFAFRAVKGVFRREIGELDFGRDRIEHQREKTEVHANFAGDVAGREHEVLDSMQVGGFLKQKQQVDHVGQLAVALNAPANLKRVRSRSRPGGGDGHAAEVGLLQPALQNETRQGFS